MTVLVASKFIYKKSFYMTDYVVSYSMYNIKIPVT